MSIARDVDDIFMKRMLPTILLCILVSGCPKDDNPVTPAPENGSDGPLVVGSSTPLITQTIGPAGGTITLNKPGDPLNGMSLTVQSNSFNNPATFTITSAPILEHRLGEFFNPVSPLIEIESNGEYSTHPMKLRVPISLPQGSFAMGFYYDKVTGAIEAIPVDDLGSDYVVLSTMHFTSPSALAKRSGIAYQNPATDIVITIADEALLTRANMIESNFTPGIDDWEFINYGSYIAPNGHCAGQSITALWYFDEKRKNGSPQLFHGYDSYANPAQPAVLWQDNPRGYRFASSIQQDANFDVWIDNVLDQSSKPDLTLKSFALAIANIHRPQLVLIRKSTPPNEGHAMIIYKVDYPNKRLYVADPNFPGNMAADGTPSIRFIDYKNNVLGPYHSSLNADTTGVDFDQIGFAGKSAYVNWQQLQKRWAEFEAGTVGNDRFPPYQLNDLNNPGFTIGDGYINTYDTLKVSCRSTAGKEWIPGTDHLQYFYIYDGNGNFLTRGNTVSGVAKLPLKVGTNTLGFYVGGKQNANTKNYVDFRWLNIGRLEVSVSPDTLYADANTDCKFTAVIRGPKPSSTKYEWDFGDSTAAVTHIDTDTITHRYTKGGNYTVTLRLYDNSSGRFLGGVYSRAVITKSIAERIAGTTSLVSMYLNATYTTDNPNFSPRQGAGMNNEWSSQTFDVSTIHWSGLSFDYTYAYHSLWFSGWDTYDTTKVTGTISGTLAEDGKSVLSVTGTENRVHSATPESSEMTITAHNVPFFTSGQQGMVYQYTYQATGSGVQSYVNSVHVRGKLFNSESNSYEEFNSSLVSYDIGSWIGINLIQR